MTMYYAEFKYSKNLLKTVTTVTVLLMVRSFAQMTNLLNSGLTVRYDGTNAVARDPEKAIDA